MSAEDDDDNVVDVETTSPFVYDWYATASSHVCSFWSRFTMAIMYDPVTSYSATLVSARSEVGAGIHEVWLVSACR